MLDISNPNHFKYETKHLEVSVLGGIKLNNLDRLRVTLKLSKRVSLPEGVKGSSIVEGYSLRHNIDLYNDNLVEKLVRKAAERLEIGTSIIRKSLEELINELETYRLEQLDKEAKESQIPIKQLTGIEKKEAETFLKSKHLLKRTNELIGKSGVIGEETNRLLMYLIFTSRKISNPLHCISLGSSGTGKTHLQSKVAELIPEEDKVEITVLSANAFYYFNRTELRNKLILIEDLDGAESVLYPLRELQSKKRITKTVVHKDTKGTTKTIHLTVEGPVSVAGCTTRESVYEDNSNRSFLLYIDESTEQDRKIMDYQRKLSAGKANKEEEFISARFLRDVQRCLKPIKVINPYAEFLELPENVFKPRRTNAHYLQLIEAVTFYCQYQRSKKYDESTGEEYIETTIKDIKAANGLITEVLLRKSDTLTGACRNYIETLKEYLSSSKQPTFTAFEVRKALKVKKTTQWRYHQQLLENYYIRKIKTKKGETITRYELVNANHYQELAQEIARALARCLVDIECSTVPEGSTSKMEQVTKRKTAS